MNKINRTGLINIVVLIIVVLAAVLVIKGLIQRSDSPKYSEGDCIALTYGDIRESWETPLSVYATIKKVGIKKYLVYTKLNNTYYTETFEYTERGSIKIDCLVN